MAATCTNYDEYIERWNAEVYSFCLVLTLDTKTADEMTFQAFLRLGKEQPGMDEASARMALYTSAFSVSEAFYLKKNRRSPRKKKLGEALGTDGTDPFAAYLRMPFHCRASAYLLHIADFTPEDTGKILRMRPRRVIRLGNVANMEQVAAACRARRRSEDAQYDLSDRLYTRFAERNVAFETRMLDLRQRFDRIVPFLSLFILILFACAIWYSLRVSAGLPLE